MPLDWKTRILIIGTVLWLLIATALFH